MALFAAIFLLAVAGFSGSGQTSLPTAEPAFVGPVRGVEADSAGLEPGAVRVSWIPAENAQVHFVMYLESEDAAAGNFSRAQMAPFRGAEGVVRGLEGGTSYSFIVIGMRWNFVQFGTVWGDWSGWVSATPAGDAQSERVAPPSPVGPASVGRVTNLEVSVGGQEPGSVRVAWTEAGNAQVHFVMYVESEDAAAGNFSRAQMAPFRGAEGVVRGLEVGTSYDFIVIGMRWDFVEFEPVWGGWSSWVSATPGPTSTGLAPVDASAFHALMVGSRLDAGDFDVEFTSPGRFIESERYPGSYSYSNTGLNTGTLTLDYDGDAYGGSCTVHLTFDSATTGTWNYNCASGIRGRGTWMLAQPGLRFVEGESTVRLVPENTPGGINVGRPVAATGGDANGLTYSLGGPDANSFAILPDSGQIRTRDGVSYDHETRYIYSVTVTAIEATGGSASIEVTILVENLEPGCETLQNLRANYGDRHLTLRWEPARQITDTAEVLGYQTEIRLSNGRWTNRRTVLGRSISSAFYANLDNGIEYQSRVRVITAEGHCGWSQAITGVPSSDLAPQDSEELANRFRRQPVGSPDHNIIVILPERCRHTAGGIARDATCRYENTGPNAGRIFLDFDDPSLGSCEVTLAYSSLTAGSFVDECFDAGVNTNISFDLSLEMPPVEGETDTPSTTREPQRAPRNQDEFVSLVHGRDDFIPGLSFGVICRHCGYGRTAVDFGPGWAARTELDPADGSIGAFPGRYTYEGTGASSGRLTFTESGGGIYVFDLEFEPSGNVSATITDAEGNVTNWPGILHATLESGAQPILLPIPPSWSAAIAIETDFAPADYQAFYGRLRSLNPDHDGAHGPDLLWLTLFGGDLIHEVEEVASYGNLTQYEKIGRNRARVIVTFDDSLDVSGAYDAIPWSSDQELFVDSEWVFELTFTGEDTVTITATRLKDGEPPLGSGRATIDLRGGRINLEAFPEETVLPALPPQASGSDRSGVAVAAAVTARQITGDDIQTFLVSSLASLAAAYRPGDWLEPKDGSYQRMMIVGATPANRASTTLRGDDPGSIPEINKDGVIFEVPISWTTDPERSSCVPSGFQATGETITQLSLVCMQIDQGIPNRGARFFSEPKEAAGPVQLCQRDCVLNRSRGIQGCVWQCEEDAGGSSGSGSAGAGRAPALQGRVVDSPRGCRRRQMPNSSGTTGR